MAELIRVQQNVNKNLLGFIPSMLIKNFIGLGKNEFTFPRKSDIKTVIMFADISGFTALSEALQVKGQEGSEILAFALNRYMELLVKSIGRSGGDIFKFAGDAMIVLWPSPSNLPKESHKTEDELLTDLCRVAIQSALDIQSKLHETTIVSGVKLSVKIGFGIGDVSIIHVGGEENRAEFLPTGDPLIQAFEAEHHATTGGVVHVSKQVHEKIKDFFNFERLEEHDDPEHVSQNAPFYNVKSLKGKPMKYRGDALLIKTQVPHSVLNSIRRELMKYVPKALLSYMMVDQEKWASEIRKVSTMFVNLGIDLRDAKTSEGLERIQRVIKTVQKVIYQSEGSLNKILMDDKGSTLIVIFGLYPLAHYDDAARAVLAGVTLIKELKKIECKCAIGVTSGVVFAGIVGTSGSRREFSILGDSVNLSARFMQAACVHQSVKIFVDEATKQDSANHLTYKFIMRDQVKGKKGLIPFYTPIDPDEISRPILNNTGSLLIHRFGAEEVSDDVYSGRERDYIKVTPRLDRFLRNPNKNRGAILVSGEFGGGKTLFARAVFERVQELKKPQTTTIVVTLNSISRLKTFNGSRPVLKRIILAWKDEQPKMAIEEIIIARLQELCSAQDKDMKEIETHLKLLDPILGTSFDKTALSIPQVFTRKQNITDPEEEKKIVKLMLYLVQCFLSDLSKFNADDSMDGGDNSQRHPTTSSRAPPAPALILLLDDFQDFDSNSVLFFRKLCKRISRIFLYINIRDNYNEVPMTESIHDFKKYIEESFNDNFFAIYLENLEKQAALNLICQILKCQLVDPKIADVILQKTQGNPNDILSTLQIFKEEGFYWVNEEGSAVPTDKFMRNHKIGEFLHFNPGSSFIKKNAQIADRISVNACLILKAACVIGHIFDFQVLTKINPFRDEMNMKMIKENLDGLVEMDFIEVLDEGTSNVTYRFSSPMLREVLYHRLLYSHRRIFHGFVADVLQTSNIVSYTCLQPTNKKEEIELETLKLTYHYSQAEESKEKMTKSIIRKSKRAVFVKRIIAKYSNVKQMSNSMVLKQGFVEKQSGKEITMARRFMILTPWAIKYFYTEEEFLDKKEPLGTIPLGTIHFVVILGDPGATTSSQFTKLFKTIKKEMANVFLVSSGMWMKKDKEKSAREFFFTSSDPSETEDWVTLIEFARTSVAYNDFVQAFGQITLPLNKEDYNEQIDLEGTTDLALPKKKELFGAPVMGNTGRRNTNLKGMEAWGRAPSVSSFDIGNNAETGKQIRTFFDCCNLLFWTHLVAKNEEGLGEITDFGTFGGTNQAVHENIALFKPDYTLINATNKSSMSTRERASESGQEEIRTRSQSSVVSKSKAVDGEKAEEISGDSNSPSKKGILKGMSFDQEAME